METLAFRSVVRHASIDDRHPLLAVICRHTVIQRLLQEISIVLSGKPHIPTGSMAPWLLPGGLEALNAPRRGPHMVIGVGGPYVPEAILTQHHSAASDLPSNGGRGLLDAVSASCASLLSTFCLTSFFMCLRVFYRFGFERRAQYVFF